MFFGSGNGPEKSFFRVGCRHRSPGLVPPPGTASKKPGRKLPSPKPRQAPRHKPHFAIPIPTTFLFSLPTDGFLFYCTLSDLLTQLHYIVRSGVQNRLAFPNLCAELGKMKRSGVSKGSCRNRRADSVQSAESGSGSSDGREGRVHYGEVEGNSRT